MRIKKRVRSCSCRYRASEVSDNQWDPIMSEQPLHRHYLHYSELPYSQRVLYTATLLVLGLGYLFALLYLAHTQIGRDGKSHMTVEDIVITYSGTGKGSRLESALRGPMQSMAPADEMNAVVGWVQAGADRAKYEK